MKSLLAFCLLSLLTMSAAPADPTIVEFGPAFRSRIGGVLVGDDGTVWVNESDGVAQVSPQGHITQTRRADDCHRYYCQGTGGIGVGPDGAIWANGGDRILRFASDRSSDFNIVESRYYQDQYNAFAATGDGLYTSTLRETGLLRLDVRGNRMGVASPTGYVQKIIAGPRGILWFIVTHYNRRGLGHGATLALSSGSSLTQGLLADYLSTRTIENSTVAPDGTLIAEVATDPSPGGGRVPPAIVRITPRGNVEELAQLPQHAQWYNSIGGIAAQKNGAIWFTEPQSNRIARIAPDGTLHEFRDGIPSGATPTGIAFDRIGSVWFTDPARGTLDHLLPDGKVRIIGQALSPLNTPGSVVATDDGAAWFIETLSWHPRIARVAPDGVIEEFRAPLAQYRATLQPVGNSVAYIARSSYGMNGEMNGDSIAVVHPDGSTEAMGATGCLLTQTNFACLPGGMSRGEFRDFGSMPQSVVRGPDGALWFTDVFHSRIGRVAADGAFTFFSAGLTRWHSGPQYITNGPDGALWFTEIRDRVGRITTDGKITEFSAGIPFRSFIGGIVAGPDGNLWFPLWHGNELARMTPNGIVTRFRRGIYPSRGNDDTVDSVPFLDKSGRVWFNEPQGGRVARASLSVEK